MLFRCLVVIGSAATALGLMGAAFWQQDWQYSLPAERPLDLVQPPVGAKIALPLTAGRPTLLHFLNPDCPCSRFNADHVRSLMERFGQKVRFVAVVGGRGEASRRVRAELKLDMEVLPDETGDLAERAGIYATPQAVVLDAQGRLYFRGNYNRSRYCLEPEAEYARLALEALLAGHAPPQFPAAEISYGCPLRKKARS